MDLIVEPFRYFTPAIFVAAISGALLGLVGVFVIVRGMAYVGHGLSHAIFGWAVVSFVGGINFYLGAGAGGLLSALLINSVARRRTIGADASIGIVTTAIFAAGVALISRYRSFTRNFEAALFGNVLGVNVTDLAVVALTTVMVTAVIFLGYRSLLYATFDPEVAGASGVSTRSQDLIFSVVLAASIIVTMRFLGVTLIAAALVTPPSTARMLTSKFSSMIWLSTAIGAVCGFAGVYLSYYLDIASGAAVVLFASLLFAIVFVGTSFRASERA